MPDSNEDHRDAPHKKHDCFEWVRLTILFLTLIAVGFAAFFTGYIAYYARETMIGDQRAWIAPRGAEFAGPIEVGRALRINILYENVGKKPALNVTTGNIIWAPFRIEENVHGEAWLPAIPAPPNTTCVKTTVGQKTVYPASAGGPYRDLIYVFNREPYPSVSEEFINRQETFFIQGCFTYRTFDEIDESPFCLYVQPTRDDPPEQWTFRFCPSGNYAN